MYYAVIEIVTIVAMYLCLWTQLRVFFLYYYYVCGNMQYTVYNRSHNTAGGRDENGAAIIQHTKEPESHDAW